MEFKEQRPLYILEEIGTILRGEGGCAWDRKQTMASLKPYVIEEAYELYDAIDAGDMAHIREELGDLVFQVYSIAQIAAEQGHFTIDDVGSLMAEKLIRRHPHVFGEDRTEDTELILERWEKIKKQEKTERESILDGVPRHLPALLKAYRMQQKAARLGFDWEKIDDIFVKLDEELAELREAVAAKNRDEIAAEAGDLLFTIVNILRALEVNPEDALALTNRKFMERFGHMEKLARARGTDIEHLTLAQLDALWNEAKEARG